MPSLPRVLTIDTTGTSARFARAALDLLRRPAIQVDVPSVSDALDELKAASYALVISSTYPDPQMRGDALAAQIKRLSQTTAIMLLLPTPEDSIIAALSGGAPDFLLIAPPMNADAALRAIAAALDGADMFAAIAPPAPRIALGVEESEMGELPALDLGAATNFIDKLVPELSALSVLLTNRMGDTLLERGTSSSLVDQTLLADALRPLLKATINSAPIIGGNPTTLHFLDGTIYDIFALTIGYHYVLIIVYDGQTGSRQFGTVNRFARRTANDLTALIGDTLAYQTKPMQRTQELTPISTEPQLDQIGAALDEPILERAETWNGESVLEVLPPPIVEERPKLTPIEAFDPSLFDENILKQLDLAGADDLFDPDELEEIANQMRRERSLTYEQARELGLLP